MGSDRVTDPIAIEEQLHRILSSPEFDATARQKKARPPEPCLYISSESSITNYFKPTCFMASLQRELTFGSFFSRQSKGSPPPAATPMQNRSKS